MNIFKRMFGGSTGDSQSGMSVQEAQTIMQHYSKFMQTNSPAIGHVADSQKLPYSKKKIKEALIIAITNIPDPQAKSALSIADVHLANWQDGVGNEDVGMSLMDINPEGDVNNLIDGVLSKGNKDGSWEAKVMNDAKKLEQEINQWV